MSYYYANVKSWRVGYPKGRQRNGPFQTAILRLAQFGIAVVPNGATGYMDHNIGAGDPAGSLWGLGMVSSSPNERATNKWA